MPYTPMKWTGYTRVSGQTQASDGQGLDIQADAIREWVRSRGDILVAMHEDAGVPGTMAHLTQRVGLVEALDDIRDAKADGIVVTRLDRIGRDLLVQEWIIYQLWEYDARLGSVADGEMDQLTSGNDPTRVMLRQVLSAIGQYERAMIVARCAAGKARKRAGGGWVGGRVPYGYAAINGELVEQPVELEAIAQALTLRKMGVTYDQISEFFLACGIRLRTGTGKVHVNTVRRVLERARVSGYPQPAVLNNLARMFVGMPVIDRAV